jgi:hypothetical protein
MLISCVSLFAQKLSKVPYFSPWRVLRIFAAALINKDAARLSDISAPYLACSALSVKDQDMSADAASRPD